MLRHLVDMEVKARVPFERTKELERERLNHGVAETWVEHERLHIGSKAKRAMNVRFDGNQERVSKVTIKLDGPADGQVSAAADTIKSRGGHERSECLGAFHSSAVCCNAPLRA